MKKAFDLLTELDLAYTFHDYKKQSIDSATLQHWLEVVGQDIILNKKGTTWRKLTPEQQQDALSSQAQLIQALIAQPSLIKRPVLATEQGYIVGFDEEKYRALK